MDMKLEKMMLAGKSSFFLATVCGHAVEQKSSMMAGKQVLCQMHGELLQAGRKEGKPLQAVESKAHTCW